MYSVAATPLVSDLVSLLQDVCAQARHYEQGHRVEAARFEEELIQAFREGEGDAAAQMLDSAIRDALAKAETNREIAERVEALIERLVIEGRSGGLIPFVGAVAVRRSEGRGTWKARTSIRAARAGAIS